MQKEAIHSFLCILGVELCIYVAKDTHIFLLSAHRF